MTHIEPLLIDKDRKFETEMGKAIGTQFIAVAEKINEIAEVLNSLTEKKLPVECEPEKTAESGWKSKVRKLWEGTNSSDDWINLINDILSSHTEQKKEELIEKIEKLARFIDDDIPVGEIRYQCVRLNDVIHLIKEL